MKLFQKKIKNKKNRSSQPLTENAIKLWKAEKWEDEKRNQWTMCRSTKFVRHYFTLASCKSRSYLDRRDWWMCSDCMSNFRQLVVPHCSDSAPCHWKEKITKHCNKMNGNGEICAGVLAVYLRIHERNTEIVFYLPRCWSRCCYQRFQCAPDLLLFPLDGGRIVFCAHRFE